jgi:hypothetical protein
LSHTSSSFCSGYFEGGVLNYLPRLTSNSSFQLARISTVSNQCLASFNFYRMPLLSFSLGCHSVTQIKVHRCSFSCFTSDAGEIGPGCNFLFHRRAGTKAFNGNFSILLCLLSI